MHFLIGLSLLYASAMGVAAIKAISIRHYPGTLLCNLTKLGRSRPYSIGG